jgi:uncharacterized protein YcnI
MLKTIVRGSIVSATALALSAGSVLAHVVVRPAEVGVAAFQTFTVGVPNEKDQATVGLRLVIPEGLNHVSPNVKPGWTIQTKKEASGETDGEHSGEEMVTEISWTGGSIPAGMRDDFLFSAQAPAEETSLVWKAYQTYQDGTVVEWDLGKGDEQPKDEEGNPDFSKKGPASLTKVVNDLEETKTEVKTESNFDQYTPWVAYGALLVAVIALALNLRGAGGSKQQ